MTLRLIPAAITALVLAAPSPADTTAGAALSPQGVGEVRDSRGPDLDVGYIHRMPEYNRFMVSHEGDQHIDPAYLGEKKWPAAGEAVTYTAHIFNKGDLPAPPCTYRWYFDGRLVGAGVLPALTPGATTTVAYEASWPADTVRFIQLPAGAMVLYPQQRERALGEHRIRIDLDPDNEVAEFCEQNNVVEDCINALTFWVYMDETTYAGFNALPGILESYSAEDWAQMQLLGLERRFWVAGCPQKIRLDMLKVVPDGTLDPYGIHEPYGTETRQADGRWGFQILEYTPDLIARYIKINFNVVMHEWGHQMGIHDVYRHDIDKLNCLITHNGTRVANTVLMPLVSPWNVFYGEYKVFHPGNSNLAWYDESDRGLMAWPDRHYLSTATAAGMNRNLGLRRGFFGDYLGAIQQGDIKLKVQRHGGAPVPDCAIRIFQRVDETSLVPDNPKFRGTTDAAGEWLFHHYAEPNWNGGMYVNNPWSDYFSGVVHKCPHPLGGNVPLVVELKWGTNVEYHIVEVGPLNIAMGQGVIDDYTIVLTTYESRRSNRLPVISFAGATNMVYLNEGQTLQATITASDPDGDPVTLSASPLYNSTFDPATGRFTFRPDSLQVTRHNAHIEEMWVDFVADDGKFTATRRMQFSVMDRAGSCTLVRPPLLIRGDLDCDGLVDFNDITAFVLALSDPPAWHARYPDCPPKNGDLNDNGQIEFGDINPFVALLSAP
ncbi:MAG: CARDB domain-containing protein [Planctomycetota bacterium]